MSQSITDGTDTTTPHLVLPYEVERPVRTVVRTIPDAPAPDVILRPAGLRVGSLQLFYLTLAAALDGEALHTGVTVLEYTDTDHPAMSMNYVPVDKLTLAQQDTLAPWILTVPFQEVNP